MKPSQSIGDPIPNNTEHAVSVTLPTWESVVGYEEGDSDVVSRMSTGYPRFFIHKSIGKLSAYLLNKYGRASVEDVFMYPSYRVAQECKKFMLKRAMDCEIVNFGKIRIVKVYTPAPRNESEKSYRSQFDVGIVFFPKSLYRFCKEFWQHSGEIISSRLSEYLMHEFVFAEQEKQRQLQSGDSWNDEDDKRYVEEKFGRNLSLLEFGKANSIVRKRISSTISLGYKGGVVSEEDVYLYPSGMSSIYNAHRVLMAVLGAEYKTVVFGFPYVDTLNICEKFGPGMIHLGHGSDEELEWLAKHLETEKILAVIVECPSNPLLKTPNLAKLSAISKKFGFPLVIDDTVGNFYNINVHPYADIACSSLTKIFSGDSNVMAGSIVLNNQSAYYSKIKLWFDKNYENNLWKEDCIYLERNSRDFVNRNAKTNISAEKLIGLLQEYQSKGIVSNIYYPSVSPSKTIYDSLKTRNGGYGGLLSISFATVEMSRLFYNALELSKGPSLGVNVTLVCPYAILVHYNELDHVAQYGVEKGLIRISVGLEPWDELKQVVESALKTAGGL